MKEIEVVIECNRWKVKSLVSRSFRHLLIGHVDAGSHKDFGHKTEPFNGFYFILSSKLFDILHLCAWIRIFY